EKIRDYGKTKPAAALVPSPLRAPVRVEASVVVTPDYSDVPSIQALEGMSSKARAIAFRKWAGPYAGKTLNATQEDVAARFLISVFPVSTFFTSKEITTQGTGRQPAPENEALYAYFDKHPGETLRESAHQLAKRFDIADDQTVWNVAHNRGVKLRGGRAF